MAFSALVTMPCICPALTPARLRYSKRGTARVVSITFSSGVPKPPIWPSMSWSRVVSLSGDGPLAMLVIQSFTLRQSFLPVLVSCKHHPIPSIYVFGAGAAVVPPQNLVSSLQLVLVV